MYSGAFHAAFITTEDSVFVWGMGALGRLGLGNELDQPVPIALEIGSSGVRPMPTFVDGQDGLTVTVGDEDKNQEDEEEVCMYACMYRLTVYRRTDCDCGRRGLGSGG